MMDAIFERDFLGGLLQAGSVRGELPAVIDAADAFAIDDPILERRQAVRAALANQTVRRLGFARRGRHPKQNEVFTEQPDGLDRFLIGKLDCGARNLPVAPQEFTAGCPGADASQRVILGLCQPPAIFTLAA